tara:strand:+ start:219 stop:518 length:300 start_codon:yes stop_codon:yes gene_type:complete
MNNKQSYIFNNNLNNDLDILIKDELHQLIDEDNNKNLKNDLDINKLKEKIEFDAKLLLRPEITKENGERKIIEGLDTLRGNNKKAMIAALIYQNMSKNK